jgi:NADH dehydrogenase FAD-containing subunit
VNKNESYLVEGDYLDRANVDVIKGEVKSIDVVKKRIKVKGQKDIINYDKLLIAWGANKKRLNHFNEKEYSNVYYIEDRQSHARIHNEIIKAKCIVVMGGSFEAY